ATDGSALPGVNIRLNNSSQGTVTDFDGNFSITTNSPSDTLVFSFIGYNTTYERVGQRTVMNVALKEEATELGEVVITGFQEVQRKLFTGSAVSVKMNEARIAGMTDATQMLEGRVAGVTVDNVSGTFGTTPKIRIRGNTSINGDNQPLFVIDGVILEDLNNVSADDIESFQVLKDASATALYGTRAKSGVIVITTKRGRSGQPRVNYAGNYSLHLRPTYSQFDIMNSVDEMSVYRELYEKGIIDIST